MFFNKSIGKMAKSVPFQYSNIINPFPKTKWISGSKNHGDFPPPNRTIFQGKMSNKNIQAQAGYNLLTLKNYFPKAKEVTSWKFMNGWSSMDDKYIRQFARALESSRKTKRISLSCLACYGLTGAGLLSLTEVLKRHPHFKELSISMADCARIDDAALETFGQGLKKLKFLQKIDLRVEGKVTDLGLSGLFEGLQTLRSLKYISVNFRKCGNISDKGVSSLGNCLKRLPLLKDLGIFVNQSTGVTDLGLLKLGEGLKKQTSIENISVVFPGCDAISGIGISNVCEGLKEIPALKKIHLDFGSAEGITGMAPSNWEKLTSLKQLSLNFEGCRNFTGENLANIFQGLGSLRNLDLNFDNCKNFTAKNFSALGKKLQTTNSLQELTLRFSECSNITGAEFSDLAQALQQHSNMHKLFLDFDKCNQITDVGFFSLSQGIKGLINLQEVTMNFCDNIGDNGLFALKEAFSQFPSLKMINLMFENCLGITDIGILALSEAFKSLGQLKTLSLSLTNCSVSDKGLGDFGESLKTMESLGMIIIKLQDCSNVTESGKQNLSELLRRLENALVQIR